MKDKSYSHITSQTPATAQKDRATNGGQCDPKTIPYSPPTGRASSTTGPGLGGDNYGNGQQPVCYEHLEGSPGLGGMNHSNSGSQGKH